jgi:ribonucleoside-triphosphate reductase
VTFTEEELNFICHFVEEKVTEMQLKQIQIAQMHNIVEGALERVNPAVAKSYRDYRNYKQDFVQMLDDVYKKSQSIMYIGDKENSNTDSALVSTKRSLIFNELNKELYQKFFMTTEEIQACRDGYIYIHDMSARRDTMNCCLFDVENVLTGGFEMGNIWYNEPKTLDVAFDVIGDIVLSAASQQYGGFTIPSVETILEPYAEKSYKKYIEKYEEMGVPKERAEEEALKDVRRDFEQGFQGWEYKFNTVASSRGDYPFITVTAGTGTGRFAKMATIMLLKVRQTGQGKKDHKKPVLFPKIVFLYDENLHGPGGELEDVFEAGIECSRHTMYPDWLSLTGKGYIASMYKQYGEIISPMGCRAFLSPWYIRGGMHPADDEDRPRFVGRFNVGVVSLHLPMIYAKAQHESRDFYEVLDYYLNLIRQIHIRTYAYLGEMRASTNPLAYCEGGFYGGNLKLHDKIKPILKYATASFGITAFNELQELHNGKSLVEDGKFALEVLEYINQEVNRFKEEDGNLYAIYATPAENLCGLQVKQFRKKYGIIEGVSDREYVSNGFHCHVTEDITPIQKQDLEYRFWELSNGGKIQYVKYPINYNTEAIKTLVRRAMDMGLYEGINLSLAYCDDCGHEELEMDVCPKCGSRNLTKIDRMNGYLSYSRVHGDTRLNEAKMVEISERKSM